MKQVLLITFTMILTTSAQTILHVPSVYPTIQEGINAASNYDTVLVAPGVYYENIDFSGKNIVVGSNFLVTGDTANISQTIIDGSQNGTIVTIANGEDSTCVLTGFTLQHGGLGIFCQNSSPLISHCVIKENSFLSHFDGGVGITCLDSDPTIIRCAIVENTERLGSFGVGWGIYIISITGISSPKIRNTTIAWNKMIFGGGIGGFDSAPIIINCIIWKNGQTSISSNQIQPVVVYSDVEGGWSGEGNINLDPMFADTLNGDFTLTENSPCIDAGTAFYIFNGDTILYLPANTYNGLAPDMGFIETPYTLGTNEKPYHPVKFLLYPNYPNPFNPTTTIKYQIPELSFVTLKIFDVLGNEIANLVNDERTVGSYEVEFDATDLPSGIYFYSLQSGSFVETKKMMLMK